MKENIYYVYWGFYHPRIREKMVFDSNKFFKIDSEDSLIYYKNLFDKILSSSRKNITHIYEDFLKENKDYTKNEDFMIPFSKVFNNFLRHYTGKKRTAVRMYILKSDGEMIIDVERTFKHYRE